MEIPNLPPSNDIVVSDMMDQSVASLMGELGKHMEGQLQAGRSGIGAGMTENNIAITSTGSTEKGMCCYAYNGTILLMKILHFSKCDKRWRCLY